MSGFRRTLKIDETAAGNIDTVPFGHSWEIKHLFIHYVADAQSATRTVNLVVDHVGEPNIQQSILQFGISVSETEDYFLGAEAKIAAGITGMQPINMGPLWLNVGDTIGLVITNEQSGDLWDLYGPIIDHVGPRP